ncbi:hypothetical protein HMPREF0650_2100 [Hoylesella buccalis ATCC 35310]|uniref:Uncharacterized protein n=1 Tax=Hoylesella buccalis ATCC 35310 TaxID=679190 RepID=D1W423_9BACT|nr:hypothetical protein HMPREF0650_2100 [Hoylesella buccalis ATCC 35310]
MKTAKEPTMDYPARAQIAGYLLPFAITRMEFFPSADE